tara:strand:- start:3264 stop:3713 length:450 start_codon:yes stop_codon:yes gene_type:complete
LNFFLRINRKILLFFSLLILILFIIFIFSKQIIVTNLKIKSAPTSSSNVDISEPKFAISNESKKIYITARVGNFINKDEILLKQNVRFKSNDFSIETEKVIFDRNKQTAKSESKSLFKSKNTTITSDGFNINEKGNKIIFYGNSYIILK